MTWAGRFRLNDPTTAVQVLDYIGEALGRIGRTDLQERTQPAGANTPAALVMVARRWEDYVMLGLTEIRGFGATSMQIMRRLRALIEELLETVRLSSTEQRSRKSSAVSMPPAPAPGATRSTPIAQQRPTARGLVVRRTAR